MMMAAVFALVLSAAVSSVVSGAWSRSARLQDRESWRGALGVGLGYALGHAVVAMPTFPPGEVTTRIPYLALIAAILSAGQGGWPAQMARVLGLASLTYLVMLYPILSRGGHSNEAIVRFFLAAVTGLLSAVHVVWLDRQERRAGLRLALIVLCVGSGVFFLMARSLVLAQLALILAATLLGAWRSPSGGVTLVALTVLSALVLESLFYAFLPGSAALLIAVLPGVVWVTHRKPGNRPGVAIPAILTVILMALAMFLFVAIGGGLPW